MKALVIGGSSWDTLIHVPEIKILTDDMSIWTDNIIETVGGTGAGKALALDVLGNEVTLVTDLGNDIYRDKILDYFAQTNINVIPLLCDKSTAHTNIMHGKEKRISIFTSYSELFPKYYKGIEKLIIDSDVVFLNINNFCREYIDIIKEHNKLCVVDIHDYDPPNIYHQDFIDAADIITCSGINIEEKYAFMDEIINMGKQVIILTDGSKGLLAKDDKNVSYKIAGYTDFKYVDSNGAGDSFCAGFITEYYISNNIGKSLEFATICGGLACSSPDLFRLDIDRDYIYEIIKKRTTLK